MAVATHTKANLVTYIRDEINEPEARVFSDTELEHFIDMGAVACSGITLCNEDEEEETFSLANDYMYSPDKEFILVDSVNYIDESGDTDIIYGLQRINIQGIGNV